MAEESAIVLRKYPAPAFQMSFWKKEGVTRIYVNRQLGKQFRDWAALEYDKGKWTFKAIARGPVEETTCRDLKIKNVQEIPEKFFAEEIKKYLK